MKVLTWKWYNGAFWGTKNVLSLVLGSEYMREYTVKVH